MPKPILCVDFDGVIHSYTSGWKGADIVSDLPVPGAIDFLWRASGLFRVAIFSSRSNQSGGIEAMRIWLFNHIYQWEGQHVVAKQWFDAIEWPTEKPPALVTIDDRAVTFTGVWPDLQELLNFKPWNKRIINGP